MTRENFEKSLSAYQRRKPFRSFRVRFISGEMIEVDHPEALVLRGGVAVYLSPISAPTLFDHESVSEIDGDVERRSAG